MVTILMMTAKMVTLGLLKIRAFWNKGYDVIISAMMSPTTFYHMIQMIL